MKVEPRKRDGAPAKPGAAINTLIGTVLSKVIVAESELVLTFTRVGADDIHLICRPEAHIVTDPTGSQIPHVTGMKYEIGTGPMTVLADCQELYGTAAEVLGRTVTGASHDPRTSVFGVQFGEYSVVLSMAGLTVLYSKQLQVEFRKPLVIQ